MRSGDALSFRMGTLKAGIWPTMLVCVYCSAYYAWTWERPHRSLLLGVLAVAFSAAAVIAVLPMERVLRGFWREPFFLTWSGMLIVLAVITCVHDGGVSSPLTALFFLPLVYASLSYPLGSMIAVGAMDVGAYLYLGAGAAAPHVLAFSGSLVSATVICAWQARNHATHRAALEHASRTDSLTGSLNRRGFEERLEAALVPGRDVALLVFDLDDFKAVNDRDGHAAGDELLRWVADVLRGTLRAEDVVGRLGGDEFAAIVTGGDSLFVLRRVVDALSERVVASAGAAVFPHDGVTAGELHAVADAQMYADKRRRDDARHGERSH